MERFMIYALAFCEGPGRALWPIVVDLWQRYEKNDRSRTSEGKNTTRSEKGTAKTEHNVQMRNLTNQTESYIASVILDRERYFEVIRALFAVGISAANCDGQIQDEQRRTIEQFTAGVSAASLPKSVNDQIQRMYASPPNLQTAFGHAQKANVPMYLCEQVIEVVIDADDVIKKDERAFINGWRSLSAAA